MTEVFNIDCLFANFVFSHHWKRQQPQLPRRKSYLSTGIFPKAAYSSSSCLIMAPEAPDPTLHLPRILCLHGGGVNARIFKLQCRTMITQLKSTFRLCFADGPFLCSAGPGMIPVYKDYGPYLRWLRWLPEHAEIEAKTAVQEIDTQLQQAMDEDDAKGATGEWVGLLGFSQGAKLAASLLFMQQKRTEMFGADKAGSAFRFAVIMAGRAPLVTLDPDLAMSSTLVDASQIALGFSNLYDGTSIENREHVLRLPTIHVHGRLDQGLHLHQRLLDQYCEKGSARLVEWDGDHRVPLKTKDAAAVVEQMLEVGRETGVLKTN